MTNTKQRYAELIEMVKHHLLKEYSAEQLVSATPEGSIFFQKKSPSSVMTKPIPSLNLETTAESRKKVQHFESESFSVGATHAQQVKAIPVAIDIPIVNHETTSSKKPLLFCLNPLNKPESTDFKEINQLLGNHFPDYVSAAAIPSDQAARQVNRAWSHGKRVLGVILLSFNEGERERIFLHNISQAISVSIISAEVISAQRIEQANGWDALIKSEGLRLIIASDYAIHTLPGLMKHFKEPQKQSKHHLGAVPFLLLSDLSLYLKEPKLKPILWRAICNEFVK
jgi:hypothetical protein